MYAKLFASLYQGTLRGQPHEILVFTNLLAHTGRDGTVDKHFRAISEETGLTMDEVKAAILVLESPDPESRSPEEMGARIVRLDEHRVWGWRVVNHGKYRAIRSEDDRAEQNRLAQKRFRERNNSKPPSAESKPDKPMQRQEAEADAKAESLNTLSGKPDDLRLGNEPAPPVKTKAEMRRENAAMLIDVLNDEAGTRFRACDTNLTLVAARLSEPDVTPPECETMILRQCKLWRGTDYEKFLRPTTLFGKEKFASYYGQRDMPIPTRSTTI